MSERTDDNRDAVGKGVGGVAGAATGATLGSLAGPLGTVVGGIAGAIGGWWSGKAVADAVQTAEADDDYYQQRFTSVSSGRNYDSARPAYHLGHVAGMNPEYSGRSFDDVEPHLQRGWNSEVAASSGDWNDVRGYARDAYDRGQQRRRTNDDAPGDRV